MAKSSTSKSAKKRVNVKDLPAAEAKLTGKQMKKVKGGERAIGKKVGDQSFVADMDLDQPGMAIAKKK